MKIKYAVTGVVMLFASVANAAVLDFTIPSGGFTVAQYIDAPGSTSGITIGSGITSEAGVAVIQLDVDSIADLRVSIFTGGLGNVYFDGNSGGKEGGLGNCRILSASAQCVPNSDDNLTIAENEVLNFSIQNDAGVVVGGLFGDFTFRDDGHNLINGSIQVEHDDGNAIISVVNGIGDLSVLGASDYLYFNSQPGATQNYYISSADISAVPVPAAVWLFGSALGLLGFRKSRRSA